MKLNSIVLILGILMGIVWGVIFVNFPNVIPQIPKKWANVLLILVLVCGILPTFISWIKKQRDKE